MLCAPLYFCLGFGDGTRAAFAVPVLQGAARAFVEWFRCAVSAAQVALPPPGCCAKQQNLMESMQFRAGRGPHVAGGAVQERLRGAYYANTSVARGNRALMTSAAAAARGNANGPGKGASVNSSLQRLFHRQ